MDWSELRRWLSGDLEEITGELAYRTALRVFPLISNDLDRTWRSKVDLSPRLLNLLRGLLTMRVAGDNPDLDCRHTLQRVVQQCGVVDAYDYVPRAIRAACNLHTYPTRRDRYEELRKTLQAAKDGSRNLGMSASRHPMPYFALDTWAEVEKDTQVLSSKSAAVPPYVIQDPAKVAGSWQDLSDHLKFYNEHWQPWLQWLEFRLFGHSSNALSLSDWRAAELELANTDDQVWSTVSLLNQRFAEVLTNLKPAPEDDPEPELESQNPVAILFAADESGIIDLDRSPTSSTDLPEASDPLYLETLASANTYLEEPSDNSAALLRDRVVKYRDALLNLHQASGAAVLVVRGESLRLLKESYERGGDSLDLPPLTDQAMLSLNELVAHHNVMVSLNGGLAAIDKLLDTNRTIGNLSSSDLTNLVAHARGERLMTAEALSTLDEAVHQAVSNDTAESIVRRASESARNLMRLAVKQLWAYRRSLGAATVAIPPALYAIGKWALANEVILTTYFRTRPGMHEAIVRMFEWLHTLPLL